MLRAVLSEVEVVLSSSSLLRGPAMACGHPFELDGGSSAAVPRSVVGACPEVEREVLPGASRGCLSAKVDRADLGIEDHSSGAGRLSTPAKAWGLQRFGPELSWPASSPRREKLQKQRAAQPGACRRTLTLFSTVAACGRWRLRAATEAFDQRR